ncbi:hypothetical protein EXM22_13285 [Oceanispirochaeta crateris]|uniref:NADH:quinone oxidoreductase/Mrp antiporter transmembrane domain-containing protein n=1 Tax=Oceanispirochaeta crateris TaxID=2518645 RepID=A0A5C1QN14_9SPIO|nr:proton-conducting transporter membrane subunit [Oceanispirochaeta crateris]QEN08917.1 hypothetical protein EXM22_13285 [Oceanispirochaeta crateris]
MELTDLILAPVVLPLIGASLAFCAKAFHKNDKAWKLESFAAAIGLGLPLLLLVYLFQFVNLGQSIQVSIGRWPGNIGILYRFDGIAWLVSLLGFTVGSAAWVYSQGSGPKGPGFTTTFLIQTASMAAAAMTVDLFNLFVCLEVMGLASYILVASSEKPGAYLASFSYLMISATAMVFFLIGLLGFYKLTGSLSYEGISSVLDSLPQKGGTMATASLALIVAAVAIRVAIMPLYGWLPDAHALAPHSISAVLSGVLIKAPLFALTRLLIVMPGGGDVGRLLSYTGAITALAGVIIALSQKDTKQLLAYHSISQIGYVVCAWGAAIAAGITTPAGIALFSASFLHALYHALFKGLLFLTVGTTTDLAGERNVYKLRNAALSLHKAGEKVPITFLCFLTAAFAITAIPPFNGYASKAALSYTLKGSWQGLFLYAASLGTVASFIKLSRIYLPDKKSISPSTGMNMPLGKIKKTAQFSQLFLALMCIISGIAALPMSRLVLRLLGEVESDSLPPYLFSVENYTKTGLVVLGGILLYFLISTKSGKKVLQLIRNRPKMFHGNFVALSLGMAFLFYWIKLSN